MRITQFPACNRRPRQQVVGQAGQPGLDMLAIIASHDLRTDFPEDVQAQAAAVRVDAPAALAAGYRDLRGRCIFTIDPLDARDFDDALSLDPVDAAEERWRVGVHIADVAHYVPARSPLDTEALRRGTSVYLADRVIPMLPEQLSNDACSQRPDEDRLTMTVDTIVDGNGQLLSFECYQAVIRSCARLDYGQVDAHLKEPPTMQPPWSVPGRFPMPCVGACRCSTGLPVAGCARVVRPVPWTWIPPRPMCSWMRRARRSRWPSAAPPEPRPWLSRL